MFEQSFAMVDFSLLMVAFLNASCMLLTQSEQVWTCSEMTEPTLISWIFSSHSFFEAPDAHFGLRQENTNN